MVPPDRNGKLRLAVTMTSPLLPAPMVTDVPSISPEPTLPVTLRRAV